jgi:Flp pilus assembly protein TadG
MGGMPPPADTPRVRDNLRRPNRQRGVALVEFALVAVLLFVLLFGIIGYAYMMSFQQSLTQAAAEGARAGAVAVAGDAEADAAAAVEEAMGGYGVDCSSAGMSCDIQVVPCGVKQCVEVALAYEYRDHPLLPSMPGLGLTLPENVDYTAVAEVNE